MFESVVANDVRAAVDGVAAQVFDVDLGAGAGDEGLEFRVVEHGEPGGLDHGAEAAKEGGGLQVRLVL